MTKNFLIQQECSRLLTAAAINSSFRQALLNNPGQAISSGFSGEVFTFSADVVQRLSSIRASSLAEFASHMIRL